MSPSWTPRLPISWIAGLTGNKAEEAPKSYPAVRLTVVDHADEAGPALVSPATAAQLGLAAPPGGGAASGLVYLADGSDCVLSVVADAAVPDGHIAVNSVQQHNLHIGAGICEDFRVFVPPAGEPFELVDVELEVTLLGWSPDAARVQVDAAQLARECKRRMFGRVLALSEACVLSLPGGITTAGTAAAAGGAAELAAAGGNSMGGHAGAGQAGGCPKLLLRVTGTNTLDREAQEEVVGYHCYRGLLTQDTQIFFHTPDQLAGGQQAQQAQQAQQQEEGQQCQEQKQQQQEEGQQNAAAADAAAEDAGTSSSDEDDDAGEAGAAQAVLLPQSVAARRGGVVLLNARQRPAEGPSRTAVSVFTSDGEWFPVKRQLLRPCIALTKAVRADEPAAGGAPPEVAVDVDTLTFDRVLIFLEALALGRPPPSFGLHLCPQLLAAAQHLGLRPLEEYCQERLGQSQSRLRFYTFDEVKQRNAAGGCWLILDGMVLDVTRWLPEHPGGSRIIPAQSLNMDCSRQFELYHASRESFVYLRQFYEGEILPEDRPLVPPPSPPPSTEFLQQLREHTPWRLAEPEGEARTHLGAKRSGGGSLGR